MVRRLAREFVRLVETGFFRVDPFRKVFRLRIVVWRVSHQAAESPSACEIKPLIFMMDDE